MTSSPLLLIVLSDAGREAWAQELQALAPSMAPIIIAGTPTDAAQHLAAAPVAPTHIVLDIGMRGQDVLVEVDVLAQQCNAGTRVLALGDTNDIVLYRGLLARGVIDYLPMPVAPAEVLRLLTAPSATPAAAPSASQPATSSAANAQREKRVIAFLSAASGDGASMAALNCAFALSQLNNGSTILVDMDYQFGMVAKHLNLQNQYGIGDLFDHPDRGLDATLIKRMVANYGNLHVITAPADLRYMPSISGEAIEDLIKTLKLSYDNIILDLPHAWVPWIANCVQQSSHVVLVAQLWLKSVSHASRMMRVFRDLGVVNERIVTVINRSGARFKEGVEPRDFGRVCGAPIRYTLANDIKAVTGAEAAARTILEIGPSELANDIQKLAHGVAGIESKAETRSSGGGLFSRLKG